MMKKLFLSMLAIGGLMFTSCEKDEIDALNADLNGLQAQVAANDAASQAGDAALAQQIADATNQIIGLLTAAQEAQAGVDAAQNEAFEAARIELITAIATAEANVLAELASSEAAILELINGYVEDINESLESAVAAQAVVDAGQNAAFETATTSLTLAIEETAQAALLGDIRVASQAAAGLSSAIAGINETILEHVEEFTLVLEEAEAFILAAIEAGDEANAILARSLADDLADGIDAAVAAAEAGDQDVYVRVTTDLINNVVTLNDLITANANDIDDLEGDVADLGVRLTNELSAAVSQLDSDIADLEASAGVSVSETTTGTFEITITVGDSSSTFTVTSGGSGTQGIQGDTGSQGEDGVSITSVSYDSDSDTLTINFSDSSTQTLTGLKGVQGDTGAQGPAGDDGATGPQGPAGDDGADGATVSVQGYLDDIADLTAQLAAIVPEDGASQADLDAANAALGTANALAVQLQASLDALNADAAVDAATIASLTAQLATANGTISDLNAEIARLQAIIDAGTTPVDSGTDDIVYGDWTGTGTAPDAEDNFGAWSDWSYDTLNTDDEFITATRTRTGSSDVAAYSYDQTRTGVVSIVGIEDVPALTVDPADLTQTINVDASSTPYAAGIEGKTLETDNAYVNPNYSPTIVNGDDTIAWGMWSDFSDWSSNGDGTESRSRTRSVEYTEVDANDGLSIAGLDGTLFYEGETETETETQNEVVAVTGTVNLVNGGVDAFTSSGFEGIFVDGVENTSGSFTATAGTSYVITIENRISGAVVASLTITPSASDFDGGAVITVTYDKDNNTLNN